MNQLLSAEICDRIINVLGHFLWQGAALGCLAAVVSFTMRRATASARYIVLTCILLCMPLSIVGTYYWVFSAKVERVSESQFSTPPVVKPIVSEFNNLPPTGELPIESIKSATPSSSPVPAPQIATISEEVPAEPAASLQNASELRVVNHPAESAGAWNNEKISFYLTIAYLFGCGIFLFRLVASVLLGFNTRRTAIPLDQFQISYSVYQAIRSKAQNVQVAFSKRIAVPMVSGVFRPVILLPFSVVTGLSTDELSGLISHEIAHIRRHDTLFILIQRLIEACLFFHPCVWLLSRQVSAERENVCDDIAVTQSASPAAYADLLLRVACLARQDTPQTLTGASATGNRGDLSHRVKRLLGVGPMYAPLRPTGLLVVIGMVIAFAIVATTYTEVNAEEAKKESPEESLQDAVKRALAAINEVKAGERNDDVSSLILATYRVVDKNEDIPIKKEFWIGKGKSLIELDQVVTQQIERNSDRVIHYQIPDRKNVEASYSGKDWAEDETRMIEVKARVLPEDSWLLIKEWGIYLAENEKNESLRGFLDNLVKTVLTEDDRKGIMLLGEIDQVQRAKLMMLKDLGYELSKKENAAFTVLDVMGPFVGFAKGNTGSFGTNLLRQRFKNEEITWDWFEKTQMGAECSDFRLYRHSQNEFVLHDLFDDPSIKTEDRVSDTRGERRPTTFGMAFVDALARTPDIYGRKDLDLVRFTEISNLCGEHLSEIKNAKEITRLEIVDYALMLKDELGVVAAQEKLTEDGRAFIAYCQEVEKARTLAACEQFLRMKHENNPSDYLIRCHILSLIPALVDSDVNVALSVLEHGIALMQKTSGQKLKADDIFHRLFGEIGKRIGYSKANAAMFLSRAGARYNSVPAFLAADEALTRFASSLSDESEIFDLTTLDTIRRLSAGVPPQGLNSYPSWSAYHDLLPLKGKAAEDVERWLRANEKGSNFILQTRFLMELLQQYRAQTQPLNLTPEMRTYYAREIRNTEHSPAERYALFSTLTHTFKNPAPEGFMELAVPAVDALLRCRIDHLQSKDLLAAAMGLAAAEINEEWKGVAERFIEATRRQLAQAAVSSVQFDRLWQEREAKTFVANWLMIQVKLGRPAEAPELKEAGWRIEDHPLVLIQALDNGQVDWCAKQWSDYAGTEDMLQASHELFATDDRSYTLDYKRRAAADEVIEKITDPKRKLYAKLFYASLNRQLLLPGHPYVTGGKVERQNDRLAKANAELIEQTESIDKRRENISEFLSRPGNDVTSSLPLILNAGFKTQYNDLFSQEPTTEQLFNQKFFSQCFKALLQNGRVRDAAKALTDLHASCPSEPVYAWGMFCNSLRQGVWAALPKSNAITEDAALKDLWSICSSLHVMNEMKTGKPNREEQMRLEEDFMAQTAEPSAMDVHAFKSVAMVTSYLTGQTSTFQNIFKQPTEDEMKWSKVDSNSLAQVYLTLRPLKNGADKEQARKHIADYIQFRTHAAYAPWVKESTWSPIGDSDDPRSGVELIIASGSLAGESADWTPTFVPSEEDFNEEDRKDGISSPIGLKLKRPVLVDEAAVWMLKTAEELLKLGQNEDATWLIKRVSKLTKNPQLRERANQLLQP